LSSVVFGVRGQSNPSCLSPTAESIAYGLTFLQWVHGRSSAGLGDSGWAILTFTPEASALGQPRRANAMISIAGEKLVL